MPMQSVEELRRRLRRRWDRGAFLGDTAPVGADGAFPLREPVGSASARVIRDDFETVRAWAAAYRDLEARTETSTRAAAKSTPETAGTSTAGAAVTVEWTTRRDRTFGDVRLPRAVLFRDIDALARFLAHGAPAELKRFRSLVTEVVDAEPALGAWVSRSPRRLLSAAEAVPRLVAVTTWYRAQCESSAGRETSAGREASTERDASAEREIGGGASGDEAAGAPAMYLRQIPVAGVDTKFVERYRGILSEWWAIIETEHGGATEHHRHAEARTTDMVENHDDRGGSGEVGETGTDEESGYSDEPAANHPPGARGASTLAAFADRFGFLSAPTLIRFRVLDATRSIGGFRDLSVPLDELSVAPPVPLDRVYVVENDVTALAFPEVPRSIVVFGRGYAVADLAAVAWLRDVDVVYSGDIDTHGFAILNRLRSHLPHVRSVLMDEETLIRHRDQWSVELTPTTVDLPFLSPAESAVYDILRSNRYGDGVRLEQERIAYSRLVAAVVAQ